MKLDLSQITLVLIGFQSWVFAAILLVDKGPKKLSNRLLAAFLLLLGLQMGLIAVNPFLPDQLASWRWMWLFGFNYGPAIYFYTISLIYKEFKFKSRDLLHLSPSFILIASTLLGLPLSPQYGWLIYVILIPYSILSILNIFSYQKIVKQTQSIADRINLSWLQWMILFFSLILIIDIVQQAGLEMEIWPGVSLVYLAILVLVTSMFVKGIRQPQIFLGISYTEAALLQTKTVNPSDKDELKEEIQVVLQFLDNEKVYLDPKLSLEALAKKIEKSPRRLSYLINQALEQNFMQLINSYRIEYAKSRLAQPKDEKETILEVMYESGFNSKSSFNTLFKKATGQTPTEFKKNSKHQ